MRAIVAGVAALLVVAGTYAAPCDATYYLQGGTQYLSTVSITTTQTPVSQTSTPVTGWMGGVTVLDTHITYSVLKQFKGDCAAWTDGPVTYYRRPAGASRTYADVRDSSLVYQLFDGESYIITGCPSYWLLFPFKANPDTTTVAMIVGQPAAGEPFYIWYGTAMVVDSAQSRTGGWVSRGSTYYQQLYTLCDSTVLANTLRTNLTAGKNYGDTLHGTYTSQLIRLEYDTTVAAVSRHPAWGRTAGLGGVDVGSAASVSVYDARGRLVARDVRGMDALNAGVPGIHLFQVKGRNGITTVPAVKQQ